MSEKDFIRAIHRALRHLYEPVELQNNPISTLFPLVPGASVSSSLRKILLDGIRALKPDLKAPAESRAWRVYQVLCYRFEEQFSQEDVATQMAISPRQVRRLEFVAIRALASYLVEHYGIHFLPVVPAPGAAVSGGQLLAQPGQESEYDWLKKAYAQEVLALDKLIESILETSASLLKTCACQISVEITPRLSPVIGQPVTLRQAFLTILLAAVRAGSRGDIRISARPTGKDIVVEISTLLQEKPEGVPSQASDVAEYIEQARRLIELSSGTLMLVPIGSQHRFAASVTLHCAEEINILVIDDNEDSLLLFKRYLEGTHFQFNGTRDPQQALTMAAETQPRVIILDIMLPGIDGWELLSRLRNHPRLEKVPIIISTILPYEQLAASLGASGFIRKPVSREQLLDLLNKQVESAP